MPGLVDLSVEAGPHAENFGTDEAYVSPDGAWALRLQDLHEYRMGAYAWGRVEVCRADDVQGRSVRLTPRSGSIWPQLHGCYAPWNHHSDRVVVPTLRISANSPTYGVAAFDRDGSHQWEDPAPGWVQGVAWSPNADKLLHGSRDDLRVLSAAGTATCGVVHSEPGRASSLMGWTPGGGSIFRLVGTGSATSLRFYDPNDGACVNDVPLDPRVAVPYADAEYANLDRGPYCLKIGGGTWGSGRLLDDWSATEFDSKSSVIRLSVYRPTSPTRSIEGVGGSEIVGCDAVPVWITARVID